MLIVAIVPGPAEATEYVSGATCTIDNDDTVNESQVFLSGAEFKNDDDTNDAYLTCGIPLTAGTPDDVDVIQAYVYDGNNDAGTAVVGTVYWHGTTSGNWDACTTEDTDSTSTFTGNATDLSWSVYPGTENLDCLTGRGSGSAFMNVVLPDDDAACGGSCGRSSFIEFYVSYY